MSYGVGSVVKIDEKGAKYDTVCNLGCPHTVTPVTRFPITIVEEKKVRDLFSEGWANTGPQPPSLPAYRAIDTDGNEWRRDWDGWVNDRPGTWKTADGRRAETASIVDLKVAYQSRPSAAYVFTDLTAREA